MEYLGVWETLIHKKPEAENLVSDPLYSQILNIQVQSSLASFPLSEGSL
jgi:hypothetical protein